MILVYITCKDEGGAGKIAKKLLEKRLIACANIVPKISSMYWWKGKIEKEDETLLLCKTRDGREKQISWQVKKLHSYELPAVEFVKAKASREFEQWVKKEVR